MLLRSLAFCLLASSLTQCWPSAFYKSDSNEPYLRQMMEGLPRFSANIGSDSCVGRCGDGLDESKDCQCNSECETFGDCCDDYKDVCGGDSNTCQGKCNDGYHPEDPCQCNSKCHQYNNCCPDYDDQCGDNGGLSDADLITLSEMLIDLDEDNVADKVVLDLQCTTQSGNEQDCSPNLLFTSVSEEVMVMPIFMKLAALYDNYDPDVNHEEDHTPEEAAEEEDFVHFIVQRPLMTAAYQFLNEKGAFPGSIEDFENYLLLIWFGQYDRAPGVKGSSGFEHVFIGEKKHGTVGGFHNWFHWYWLETRGHLNYLGYWEYVTFGEKGSGISFTYTWDGTPKPYGSMFISTTPELEMALYTTCFLTRPSAECHMRLEGQTVVIQTWTNEGNPYVGTSFPDWQ